ncbi:DUF5348 domain-containing protein [Calderihabitans maritimus]|uniref:DUF5348 domain-containing protein n=1 Tax=Calderihabitans maritimus TaxID=1246530 RepID=A0A1Z5HY31_9FIRM|nr:DUF5348 domain-containing protein [Calderihabitans maritimus]GAW94277.1 hypothetical protein Desca_0754 [Calderihabitans maritimus]
MTLKQGILYFRDESSNWIFEDTHGNAYALHCGEGLEIKISGRYRPCRLELAEDWYVVFPEASLCFKTGSFV